MADEAPENSDRSAHRLQIQVEHDHLEREASAGSAVAALSELIWNALDADAREVKITLARNTLGAVERIRVSDDGHGIARKDAEHYFAALGGSWKKNARQTKGEERLLHGKDGKGRLKAFALGTRVSWNTVAEGEGGTLVCYVISGSGVNLRHYELTEVVAADAASTGTVVEIDEVVENLRGLDDAEAVVVELAVHHALYLQKYPQVRVVFDGRKVDQKALIDRSEDYRLEAIGLRSGLSKATLSVVEWRKPVRRILCLCDEDGFTYHEQSPGVKEPGFEFTAYLRSAAVPELAAEGALAADELHPDTQALLDAAKRQVKAHFRARRAEQAAGQVERWKEQGIYPYDGLPLDEAEEVGRQVFHIIAKQVQDYMPGFGDNAKATKFSMRLLREAMEESPQHLRRIIEEVLDLPAEKQKDLAELLNRIPLTSVIDLGREVTDRLLFIRGLELLLFNPQSKQQLKERSQLHKIVEPYSWIFGEEYKLSVSDKGLTEVLRKHLDVLGREPGADSEQEVLRPDGSRGIVDLMASRSISYPGRKCMEHVVVELKRPSVKINSKTLDQTMAYAAAVSNDERFAHTSTKWRFWAVSNEIDEMAQRRASARDKPFGLVYDDPDQDLQVWAMPWGVLLDQVKQRLEWVRGRLSYDASDEDSVKLLQELHAKYLPEVLKAERGVEEAA